MDQFLVKPGKKVKLANWDANDNGGLEHGKTATKPEFSELNSKLEELQELLYAESKRRMLIVLQGMDTSGKDGTIRHVFDGVNPQGVRVASFKKPSSKELRHDFLWRIHQQVPGNGEIMIFNRSHYEDVLVVRVHNLVPEEKWKKRFDHINSFEKMLHDEGTTILKFYLHIDREEQKQRLQERLDRKDKHWKFSKADLAERQYWGDYEHAFEEMLEKTSTRWAPWYVIPANRKWYRNLIISRILVQTLQKLDMKYPPAEDGLDSLTIE